MRVRSHWQTKACANQPPSLAKHHLQSASVIRLSSAEFILLSHRFHTPPDRRLYASHFPSGEMAGLRLSSEMTCCTRSLSSMRNTCGARCSSAAVNTIELSGANVISKTLRLGGVSGISTE